MANDVAVSLPAVELQPLSTLTVTLSDNAAKITKLIVHGYQDVPTESTGGVNAPLPLIVPADEAA